MTAASRRSCAGRGTPTSWPSSVVGTMLQLDRPAGRRPEPGHGADAPWRPSARGRAPAVSTASAAAASRLDAGRRSGADGVIGRAIEQAPRPTAVAATTVRRASTTPPGPEGDLGAARPVRPVTDVTPSRGRPWGDVPRVRRQPTWRDEASARTTEATARTPQNGPFGRTCRQRSGRSDRVEPSRRPSQTRRSAQLDGVHRRRSRRRPRAARPRRAGPAGRWPAPCSAEAPDGD